MPCGVAGYLDSVASITQAGIAPDSELNICPHPIIENAACVADAIVGELLEICGHLHVPTVHSDVH
jgi:hypothetical protein